MSLSDDGGAAFPRATEQTVKGFDGTLEGERGMSLRDYFAAKAMGALLSQKYGVSGMYDPNDPAQARTLAYLSYQAADAMLARRKIAT